MKVNLELTDVLKPSENIVAREIEGELIIVPLVSGIADMEDDLFTLNQSGRAIWDKLDGTNTVEQIIASLRSDYEGEAGDMEQDVLGFLKELKRRKIVTEV